MASGGASDGSSDFHLVELRDGWRLTIRVSDELLDALREERSGSRDPQLTVLVEPNLLPAEPFAVTVEIAGTEVAGAESGPAG